MSWEDVHADPEESLSPPWHEEVIHAREQRIRSGASKFVDWEEAKARIREFRNWNPGGSGQ